MPSTAYAKAYERIHGTPPPPGHPTPRKGKPTATAPAAQPAVDQHAAEWDRLSDADRKRQGSYMNFRLRRTHNLIDARGFPVNRR